MSRADAIRREMHDAVLLLGGEGGKADEQNHLAARLAGLPVTVVERLRWKKIRRIPADIADAVRDAVSAINRRAEAKANHDRLIWEARIEALDAFARHSSDPEFVRARAAGLVEWARMAGLSGRPVAPSEDEG